MRVTPHKNEGTPHGDERRLVGKRWWLLVGVVLLLAIPLVLLLRDFTREILLVELLRLYWVLRVFYESLPQIPLWVGFVAIVLIVALRSILARPHFRRSAPMPEVQRRARVHALSRRIRRSEEGEYFKWSLARELRDLILEVLAHQYRTTPEEIRQDLDTGRLDVPPEVRAYLQAGLAPMYSLSDSLFARLKQRLSSTMAPVPLDPHLEQVVKFLETQLQVRPRLEIISQLDVDPQHLVGVQWEVRHDH
jgi:hypothetical protein